MSLQRSSWHVSYMQQISDILHYFSQNHSHCHRNFELS